MKILMYLVVAFAFAFFPAITFAADPNFDISVNSSFTVKPSGITTLVQTIKIKNKSEFYYTPTYSVNVGFSNIENIQASNEDGVIPTTLEENSPSNKSIKLTFPKRYAGIDTINTVTLQFDTKDIAIKQGSIWEITIPGIATPSDFKEYTADITVPEEFGEATIIKPEKKSVGAEISFSKDEIGKGGIYILYGKRQYYSFQLKYNISNPNLFPVRTEIALPRQTNYQNVILSSLSTPPLNVAQDRDGNWIAEYRLMPQERQSVIAKGYIEILPTPISEELSNDYAKDLLKPQKYWSVTNPEITSLAKKLKTPEEIYDYVVKTLSYNYSKVATDNLRVGGEAILKDPKNSVCLEFTDLFVTIARASGIPARSVEGYAYTRNSKLRPISLVNDILHAWPEYYDYERKAWVMVDPTWGNTTHNIDYFNSLDFQHVAFVIKGMDSEYPIPAGGYKFDKESRDISVAFANATDFKPVEKITIEEDFANFAFPKTSIQGTFVVKNTGNYPVKNLTAQVTTNYGTKRQFLIDYIPPFGSKKITTTFTDIPFLTNGKYLITIQVGKTIKIKPVRISLIPDFSQILFIGGIIGGSTIIAAVTFYTGSVLVQRRKRKNTIRR